MLLFHCEGQAGLHRTRPVRQFYVRQWRAVPPWQVQDLAAEANMSAAAGGGSMLESGNTAREAALSRPIQHFYHYFVIFSAILFTAE